MKSLPFFFPKAYSAIKWIGRGWQVKASWNNNGDLCIQKFDEDGYYVPGQTFQQHFDCNSAMFEYLENRGFVFIGE